uniref:M20 family peptidase n=1 Tax=Schlesneria paludicola TaxID=360056 RepID=A0A7C2K274_9PLAN
MTDVVRLLSDLVRLPSVNPMGRPLSGEEFLEARVTEYLCRVLTEHQVSYERRDVVPQRANLLARFEGSPGAPVVVLDAHQDTVPVDGMVIAPFDAVIKEGRLYGRGACDVKGGLAAMLAAFLRLVKERPSRCATVVVSFTCDEEATSLGIHPLTGAWADPSTRYRLLPKPPDIAIVAEPTSLDAVVAHRGAVRWQISTTGRACHSSRPEEGVNAIYRMGEVLRHLQTYADELPKSRPPHPLCGPATLSVGIITGGISVNAVPDRCTIEIDRRVIPGERREDVIPEVAAYLSDRLDFSVEHSDPFVFSPALGDELNGVWADRLLASIAPVVGQKQKVGVAYGTHASRFAQAGVPSVVFGPGDIAQAHTKDEWIDLAQLRAAAECYYRFCVDAAA